MLPHFRAHEFLIQQIADALRYLYPRCIDGAGGYVDAFTAEAGNVSGTARLAGDFALAYGEFGDPAYLKAAEHGVAFLRTIEPHSLDRATLARVLSAYARASMAGVAGAAQLVARTAAELEHRCRDEPADAGVCAALLDAFDASDEPRFLHLAERAARDAPPRDCAAERARWARVLLGLERHRRQLKGGADWLLPRAGILVEPLVAGALDADADGDAVAAAALLGARTGRLAYWAWYDALWAAHHRSVTDRSRARLAGACHEALGVIATAP